jgi:DNA polymerase III delta prime subunit
MHTFYITGGSVENRLEYITHTCNELGVTSYDIHRLIPKEQALTIGISDIRPWQKELFLTPLSSPLTIGIIPNAELLTTEAQNALLKTLEEPPAHTRIYIESQSRSFNSRLTQYPARIQMNRC